MITVKIRYDSIEISGHAKDSIVCHAVSAVSGMVANYVESQRWGRVASDDIGYLKIYDVGEEYIGNPLFSAMTKSLYDICEEYPENLIIQHV